MSYEMYVIHSYETHYIMKIKDICLSGEIPEEIDLLEFSFISIAVAQLMQDSPETCGLKLTSFLLSG